MEWSEFKTGRVNVRFRGEGQLTWTKEENSVIITPFLNNGPVQIQKMEESISEIQGWKSYLLYPFLKKEWTYPFIGIVYFKFLGVKYQRNYAAPLFK